MPWDTYSEHKEEIRKMYRNGMEPKDISGRTGVPTIRIAREMQYHTAQDPELFRQHVRNKYPSNRKQNRWPNARLLIGANEQHRAAQDEYMEMKA